MSKTKTRKPRTITLVEVPLSLLRKTVRIIEKQQKLLEEVTGMTPRARRSTERGSFAITPAAATAALQLYRREKR